MKRTGRHVVCGSGLVRELSGTDSKTCHLGAPETTGSHALQAEAQLAGLSRLACHYEHKAWERQPKYYNNLSSVIGNSRIRLPVA